jgi:hypothetical protein
MFTTNEFVKAMPHRLTINQVEEAHHVFNSFFESQSLTDIREDLRQWYEAAISSNYPRYETGVGRSELFMLYNQLELLIEAAYVVDKNQEEHHKS